MEAKEFGIPLNPPVPYIMSTRALFIESLVQLLCSKYESDPEKKGKLFSTICKYLYNMNLVEATHDHVEFDTLRSHYKSSMENLIKTIQLAVNNSNDDLLKFMDSWYEIEYNEIKVIGMGAYGSVYKVQHKLDRAFYAVKKIPIRYDKSFGTMKSLQEVYALAKLNHPNIIGYKRAWIEPSFEYDYKQNGQKIDYSDTSSSTTFPTYCSTSKEDDSSSFVKFEDPNKQTNNASSKYKNEPHEEAVDNGNGKLDANDDGGAENIKNETAERKHTETEKMPSEDEKVGGFSKLLDRVQKLRAVIDQDFSLFQRREKNKPDIDEDTTTSVTSDSKNRQLIKHTAILYIQMQLCDQTLSSWIEQNKKRSNFLDMRKVIGIFKKIVKGVHYLHSEKIIHHDLKPHNIFISNDGTVVQIGDFGLSSVLHTQNETGQSDDASISTSFEGCKINSNVGTAYYAPHEQYPLTVRTYKSDIYSLGILFVDLIYPYVTRSERVLMLKGIRDGVIPRIVKEYPMIYDLIRIMLKKNHEERPTAAEVLTITRKFDVDEIVAISERLQKSYEQQREPEPSSTTVNDCMVLDLALSGLVLCCDVK